MTQDKIVIRIEDEDLVGLIPSYLENRRNDVALLHDALAQGNYEMVRNLGHKMKGSGGGYGLDRISEIGHHLEVAAKIQDSAAIKHEIAALQGFLDALEIVT